MQRALSISLASSLFSGLCCVPRIDEPPLHFLQHVFFNELRDSFELFTGNIMWNSVFPEELGQLRLCPVVDDVVGTAVGCPFWVQWGGAEAPVRNDEVHVSIVNSPRRGRKPADKSTHHRIISSLSYFSRVISAIHGSLAPLRGPNHTHLSAIVTLASSSC